MYVSPVFTQEVTMDITNYLRLMTEKGASDLFFSPGAPVNIKIEGQTSPLGETPLGPGAVQQLAYSIMSDGQKKGFERDLEMNLAITVQSIGRFRVNVYRQRGDVAMAVRYIKSKIPTFEDLNLPPILKQIILEKRGLVLIVGSTGSGKSTTLASMINYRNEHTTGHILTIEDPIEYIHQHRKSVVDQREVGLDTLSYANALKNAMREAPDVILIGEIRDRDTMMNSISYAETGHLCLSTLHANNTYQTLERIINFFPEDAHKQLFMDLSLNLKAVISQRLIQGLHGKRIPAFEILLVSPYISELIQQGKVDKIHDVVESSNALGMLTFDQSLYELYKNGLISREEALHNADSRNNLGLRIKLSEGMSVETQSISVAKDKPQAW
jgi:twitching motility protein PilU